MFQQVTVHAYLCSRPLNQPVLLEILIKAEQRGNITRDYHCHITLDDDSTNHLVAINNILKIVGSKQYSSIV